MRIKAIDKERYNERNGEGIRMKFGDIVRNEWASNKNPHKTLKNGRKWFYEVLAVNARLDGQEKQTWQI